MKSLFKFVKTILSSRTGRFSLISILFFVAFILRFGKHFHPHSYVDYLLLIFLTFTYFEVFRNKPKHIILTLSFYIVIINLFWMVFHTPATFFDISLLAELPEYNLTLSIVLIALFISSFLFSVVLLRSALMIKPKTTLVLIITLTTLSIKLYSREDWNPLRNYKKQGYVLTTIADTLLKFKYFYNPSAPSKDPFYLSQVDKIDSRPNINIIILESLFIHDKIKNNKYLKKNYDWKSVNSPSFAGESSRAEFEILCGVPSFKKPMIEFNFIRRNLKCLPSILKDLGYITTSINSGPPWTYNARKAYRNLGFENQLWPVAENRKQFKDYPGGYLYDGELFDFSLSYILKNNTTKPKLTYIFGSYGHFPYKRNIKRRPNLIKDLNKTLERVLNTNLYRLNELSRFLNKIEEKDPNSINIICGDHLPYIENFNYGGDKNRTYCYSNKEELLSGEKLFLIPANLFSLLGCNKCLKSKIDFAAEYLKLILP